MAPTLFKEWAALLYIPFLGDGKEFARYETIAEMLKAGIVGGHPYASWGRGLNQVSSRLIRQHFPEHHDLNTITDRQRAKAMVKTMTIPASVFEKSPTK